MIATVDIPVDPNDSPHVEYEGFIKLAENVTIHLPVESRDGAAWCRQFAALLVSEAERLEQVHQQALDDIEAAYQEIGEIRHDKGEIAADGICHDCHNGDHAGHKPYVGGRCYGCTCPPREAP